MALAMQENSTAIIMLPPKKLTTTAAVNTTVEAAAPKKPATIDAMTMAMPVRYVMRLPSLRAMASPANVPTRPAAFASVRHPA